MSKLILLITTLSLLVLNHDVYGQTLNASLISNFCPDLKESSGLCFANNEFYTINDSGNSPDIYVVDTSSGCWSRKIHVLNENNYDWESIIVDNDFLYIGDFGNNNGNRTNLRILKIQLDSIALRDTVTAEKIEFDYAQQIDFTSMPNNNPYDCEAFISEGDSLYLFSKNWTANNSQIYSVSKVPGSYSINTIYTIPTTGKITDAYYDGLNLKLIGYVNLPFCQFYNQLSSIHQLMNVNAVNYSINVVGSPQIESICFVNNEIYFTSEEFTYSTITFPAIFGRLTPAVSSVSGIQIEIDYFVSENQLNVTSAKMIEKIEIFNLMGQKTATFAPMSKHFKGLTAINTGIMVITFENNTQIRKRF